MNAEAPHFRDVAVKIDREYAHDGDLCVANPYRCAEEIAQARQVCVVERTTALQALCRCMKH